MSDCANASIPSSSSFHKFLLNVGGDKFEFSSLKIFIRCSTSRLGKLSRWPSDDNKSLLEICDDYNLEKNEFFFDRNSKTFSSVLRFYYTGKLHMPDGICVVAFTEDLKYWGIAEAYLDSCCLYKYFKLLEQFQEEVKEREEMTCILNEDNFGDGLCGKFRQAVWNVFESPSSSLLAKIVAVISVTSIVTSTLLLALNTMPEFQMYECIDIISCEEPELELEVGIATTVNLTESSYDKNDNRILVENYYFALIEEICIIWFTCELLARFFVSPNKCAFLKELFNIFDLLAIIPYFITLLLINSDKGLSIREMIQACRLMRIIRVFKLARHSTGLQSFLYTLRESYKELGILFVLLVIGILLFSSFAYYAEKETNLVFESIPAAFWWAVVTMNAVGLGNMQPVTTIGKLVSFICGVCGMLFIGLPIPVIVDSFTKYYNAQNQSLKIVKKYQSLKQDENSGWNKQQILAENSFPFLDQLINHPGRERSELEFPSELTVNKLKSSSRPILNVGGVSFEVTWTALDLFPNSRLSQLYHCKTHNSLLQICDDYSLERNEYFFHRDSQPFNSILNAYVTRKFHLLEDTYCSIAFCEEMAYWNLNETQLEVCCQYTYNRKKQDMRKEIKEINYLLEGEEEDDFGNGYIGKLRKHVWNLLEQPTSSYLSKIVGLMSTVITFLSAFILTLKSLPSVFDVENKCATNSNLKALSDINCVANSDKILEQQESHYIFRTELFCIAWFGWEYVLRLVTSPSKLNFMRRKLDGIDPLIVASYTLSLYLITYHRNEPLCVEISIRLMYLCEILRILRLLRILKLGKHSTALKALGYTLKSSFNHLGVLLLFLAVGVFLFSCLAYFCEKDENPVFESIPTAFWWALVTMHAVTVGDMLAATILGKVVSFLCGLFGLLFLVLPIPIIASNFQEFYKKQMRTERAQSKQGINKEEASLQRLAAFENEEDVL